MSYFKTDKPIKIKIFAGADFGNVVHENKSISGLVCSIEKCTIDWGCRKQTQVSTSTCKSEVNSILDTVNEAEYLRELTTELSNSQVFEQSLVTQPIIVYNDKQSGQMSCITNGKFQVNRHYRLRLGRKREAIETKLIRLKYCPGEKVKADLLTKTFTEGKLVQFLDHI